MPLVGDSVTMTWLFFFMFTIVHLSANWIAVTGICFDKLNRQRMNIVIDEFLKSRQIKSPRQVQEMEKIFYFQTIAEVRSCTVTLQYTFD